MSLHGIDHLVLHVNDMERALTFYRRLGFEVLWEEEWRRYERHYPVLQVAPGQFVHLIARETTPPLKAAHPEPGAADVCFIWDGPADEIAALLAQNSIRPELGPVVRRGARGLGTSYFFRDPDGNLIEFLTYHVVMAAAFQDQPSSATQLTGH